MVISNVIVINTDKQITCTVYDWESDDEFLSLRIKHQQGPFIGKIREAYEKVLEDIREKCFIKDYYIVDKLIERPSMIL